MPEQGVFHINFKCPNEKMSQIKGREELILYRVFQKPETGTLHFGTLITSCIMKVETGYRIDCLYLALILALY